jgi:hypothetical protein
MTQIKPTYVTFEQARKLKQKGFNTPCQFLYVDGKYRINSEKEGDLIDNRYPSTHIPIDWCLAPEQWQVIEWLRVVHGIWIHIYYLTEEKCWGWDCYRYEKENGLLNEPAISFKMNLKSPQEAYSLAFDYVLNKLI